MWHRPGVLNTSQGVQCLWPVRWWVVEVAVVEGGGCRHTGGTGTVAGTADNADIVAFADSNLNKTYIKKRKKIILQKK